MNRNSTLSIFVIALSLLTTSLQAQHTYVDNGSSNNYNLGNGDSLYVASGTFTGNIWSFNTGAKITIAGGANFQPGNLSNPKGSFINYGNCKFSGLSGNSGFTISNWGTFWVTGSAQMNGSDETWTNEFGGMMRFDNGLDNNSNDIINKGTLNMSKLNMNNGSTITNYYVVNISGDYNGNTNTVLTNGGTFTVDGKLTFNSNAAVANTCRLISNGGIVNNGTSFNNSGLVWAKAAGNNSYFTNSGTYTSTGNGCIKAVTFTNHGTLRGNGKFYLTGTTTSTGTVGVAGTTSDTLRIYDATRSKLAQTFDVESGTINANAIYQVLSAPDTLNNLPGCSVMLIQNIPLAVQWNYFFVNMANNIPSINWSANFDANSRFDVERSYDGSNFTAIKTFTSPNTTAVFTVDDATVNTQVAVVYYRIKSIEPSGVIKYSETRTVKFGIRAGVTIQAMPNPFTSQFTINYQSAAKGTILINVFSMNGQLQFSKTAAVSAGYNSISVTEAARVAKGMYLVQVSSDNAIVATERLVKQ